MASDWTKEDWQRVLQRFEERVRRRKLAEGTLPNGPGVPQADSVPSSSHSADVATTVPLDGSPWSDEQRRLVTEALAALRASRQTQSPSGYAQASRVANALRDVDARAVRAGTDVQEGVEAAASAQPLEAARRDEYALRAPLAGGRPELPACDEPVETELEGIGPTTEFAIPLPAEVALTVRWVGPDEAAFVAGYRVPGPVYVGSASAGSPGTLDAGLSVLPGGPDWDFHDPVEPRQIPSYQGLSPQARSRYLAWLADHRRSDAPWWFAELFFLGLESRVVQVGTAGFEKSERQALQEALQDLDRRFGARSARLGNHTRRLQSFLCIPETNECLFEQPAPDVSPGDIWQAPMQLAMSQAAQAEVPLSAQWAFACVAGAEDTLTPLALLRFPTEFKTYFEVLFEQVFPQGLRLVRTSETLAHVYQPLGPVVFGAALPSVVIPSAQCEARVGVEERAMLRRLWSRCATDMMGFNAYAKAKPGMHTAMEAQLKLPLAALRRLRRLELQALAAATDGKSRPVTPEEAAFAIWGDRRETLHWAAAGAVKRLLLEEGFTVAERPRAKGAPRNPVRPDVDTLQASASRARLRLDPARLGRVRDDDARATRMLDELFGQEEGPAASAPLRAVVTKPTHRFARAFPSLDAEHLELLEVVVSRDRWDRDELERHARQHDLMLDGALEELNGATHDLLGDYLLTDDGDIEVSMALVASIDALLGSRAR